MIDPAWVSALSAILFIIGLGGAFSVNFRCGELIGGD